MINRPKVKPNRQLELRSNLRKPVLKSSKITSKVFGRAASFETTRLSPPLSLIENKRLSSTSLKDDPVALCSSYSPSNNQDQPSTHAIASILDDMEAYPRIRRDSHHSWERDQPSLRINTLISGYSRDSVELNPPQPNEAHQGIYSSLRPRLSRESPMAAASRAEQSVLSISSGESSGSRGSKNSSGGSQQSGSTLRVVGRGGSGSRLRQFDLQSQKPDPALIVKQEHRPPLVRPSGRGGLGSRPKPLAAPLVPPKDNAVPKPSAVEAPILIRPSGRGGLASRPKVPGSVVSPTLLKFLGKRKARVDKGKGKAPEPRRAIHPIPPNQTYSVSNASSSSLSTIHFVGETGEPSTPFFPDDRSIDSNRTDAEGSIASPSSMFNSDQSSSKTSILSDQPNDNDEQYNESRPTTPVDHRQRNISKLNRTLGDFPDDAFNNAPSRHPPEASPPKRDETSKGFRRTSISMTSLSSIFSRSGGRARDSIAASTITDDLHQFGLTDDLSDSWDNMNESSSSICHLPASPIIFSPPSPLAGPNLKAPSESNPTMTSSNDTEAEKTMQMDTLSCASSTLSRSNSYSVTPSLCPSIASHSRSTFTSILGDNRLENRSIWLIPVTDDDDMEVGHFHHIDVADRPQNWSGEWNNDLHHVIKSLRLL